MNIQIFPNWVKKIAIVIFILSFIISSGDEMANAWKTGGYEAEGITFKPQSPGLITVFFGGKQIIHIFEIVSLVSMLIYLMSKEKIEDEFIQKLRLESFQITSLVVIVISLFLYTLDNSFDFQIGDSINNFLSLYLIIFFFKKRFN